jgi:hypothetical protein
LFASVVVFAVVVVVFVFGRAQEKSDGRGAGGGVAPAQTSAVVYADGLATSASKGGT